MQQDRDFRQWKDSLRVAMRTWESSGFDEGALLRGKPLVDTEYWERQRFLELSTVERSFIGLSVEFRERESRKKKRRRQFTVLGLSIGLVVALSLAGVAGWQSQNSLKSEIQALSASSEALFASNQELEGLTAGIRAGQQLKKLPWVDASTQTTVANVLQNVLYRIKEYNRLEGHRGGASQFVFSSNGQIIATVGKDGTVKLWKPDGTPLNRPWLNNFKEVSAVAFSPKNQIIATASGDTVTLWSLDGVKQKILSAHKGDIGAIAFSPDSKIIAIATTKVEGQQKINTLQLWNPDNGTLLKNLEGVNVQMAIAFSPDGKIIASGGWGGLKLWKADGGWQPLQSYQQGAINAVSFSPNSQIIAAASVDKNVYLWKRDSTGKYETKPDKILQGHSDAVWGVNFSPEGELIATASGDKTVKIWKTDGSLVTTLKGHRDVVRAVAYSPDAQTLASASDDGSVKLWKPDGTSLKALKHDSQLYAVAYSPNDKKIITTNGHGYVSFWQDNGKLLKTEKWRGGPVQTAVFSPNGELIVITSSDRSVQISKSDGTAPKFLAGHTGELNQKVVLGASFSPDSQMIATGGEDGTVQLWTTDGKLYKTLQAGGDRVWGVSFSPNGELMASAHNDKTVKLWKRDGTLLKTLSAHRDAVRAVAFSPDDQIIATASNDKTVKLWKRHGTLLKTLSGHGDTVRAVAFSPDGKTLASASKDETVILWDLQKNLDIKQLLVFGCDWVRDYLKTNPNVSDNDKHLCDGVANKK
jgi:WD40 repeat protein